MQQYTHGTMVSRLRKIAESVPLESKLGTIATFNFQSKEFAIQFEEGFNAAVKTFLDHKKNTYLDFSMPDNQNSDSHPFNRGWAMLYKLHMAYGTIPNKVLAVRKSWMN